MVHDHITYRSAYFNLSPGIRLALEYLARTDLGALGEGRHDVDGDRVFALVSDYDTRCSSETFWEAHQRQKLELTLFALATFLAVFLLGHELQIADLMTMMAALLLAAHVAVGATFGGADLVQSWSKR